MAHYDETAELSLLGAALSAPRITESLRIQPADFYQPVHEALWTAICGAHSDGHVPDPATVLPRVQKSVRARAAQVLVQVVGLGIPANAEAYAAAVRDRAERRRLEAAIAGAQQRLNDPDIPVEDVVAHVERALIGGGPLDRAAERLLTLDEFCGQPVPTEDWVAPGLLARGERLVLTGLEGCGKSVWLRQIATMVAAGLDPHTLQSTRPARVLYVDAENPLGIMVRKMDPLRQVARTRGRTDLPLWIRRFPEGLDLASPADRMELHHLCSLVMPDLLVIGPVYKLYVGGAGAREEDLARQVTSVLDGLREEFGCALMLEHHSPHAAPGMTQRSVRPIGSSLWLRWPEFGMGIRPRPDTRVSDRQLEVVPWRGAREDRPWPRRIHQGPPGGLPWVITPDY